MDREIAYAAAVIDDDLMTGAGKVCRLIRSIIIISTSNCAGEVQV